MSRTLLPLLLAAAVSADPPRPRLVEKHGPASVWLLTPSARPITLRLSDEIPVRVRVQAPAPLEVELLGKPAAADSWALEGQGGPTVRELKGKGEVVWERAYLLVPHEPGKHAVELPPLRYRSGGGRWHEVKWKPLPIEVSTQIRKAEPASAQDITGPEEVPPGPSYHWLGWAGVVAVLAAGAVALFIVRGRRPTAVLLSPEQWATRELDRLAAREPATAAEVEAFHTTLSAVLRRYLERRFHLPAERQTTPEFLQAARRSSELTPDQQALLGEVLVRCDLAKFARVYPPSAECRAAVAAVRRLVEESVPTDQPA